MSGVWFPGLELEPEVPPFQPWAAAAATRAFANRPGDDPRARCLPTGVTRMHALDLVKFVQTPGLLLALIEGASPAVRQIFLDGRSHPTNLQPTWMGHSVGRWEKDTLVIDTTGFNDKVWLEGYRPQTEQLHVIERYRRIDRGRMSVEITIDDPGAYTRPWTVRRLLQLAEGEEIQEYHLQREPQDRTFRGTVIDLPLARRVSMSLALAVLALTTVLDAQWLNHPSPAIPRTPDGKPNLSAPVPKTSDGKPDLSGIWAAPCAIVGRDSCFTQSLFFDLAKDLSAADVQMTPWAQGIQTQREARNHVDDPYGYCLPPGTPRINFGGGPFKILHTREVTAFLYETIAGMTFRQVFTDGRSLPVVTEPTWLGYSVGRWDGDVFVVETAGFRDGGWLDTRKARPHSDALRVTERFRRTDFGHMQLTITIDDRKAFLKPWTVQTSLDAHAGHRARRGLLRQPRQDDGAPAHRAGHRAAQPAMTRHF